MQAKLCTHQAGVRVQVVKCCCGFQIPPTAHALRCKTGVSVQTLMISFASGPITPTSSQLTNASKVMHPPSWRTSANGHVWPSSAFLKIKQHSQCANKNLRGGWEAKIQPAECGNVKKVQTSIVWHWSADIAATGESEPFATDTSIAASATNASLAF